MIKLKPLRPFLLVNGGFFLILPADLAETGDMDAIVTDLTGIFDFTETGQVAG